jgi:hypothetical protein
MVDRTLTCAECSLKFQASRSQWDKRNTRSRVFCSTGCYKVGLRKSSKAWWDENPDTNTIVRPTVGCAYCRKKFTVTASQHQKLVKQPDANVYCTRRCLFLNTGHTEKRRHALAWMREHPDVGGLDAARALGIPYITLRYWRKKEGMPFNRFEYKKIQTCGCCGKEYLPSGAQWHQREDYKTQVCSDRCRRELTSKRTKGVPNYKLRKHGLYSLEMEQVKQLRKAIHRFTTEGANQ